MLINFAVCRNEDLYNICGRGGGVTFSGKGLCKYSAPWAWIHHEFLFDLFLWHIMTKEGKKNNKKVSNVHFV